ncbi:helix-turn-helix transcriptional regulator [Anaerocolumna sp. AGMB13025]|uniref:helix-turn-helix domain-containing protein n=1 Tax=Anaerocolumna sp. AGMB13025 TaxID=3039116 RepID=UPI00241DE6ED|nr:helix-turn-helix transcriptional regulator [Anaerocolumna sp. AGMB13025]WFR56877.1 helix-turn-helix transcriptional regulator [Anaerocolumna sp. AGMB13025]
MRLLNISENLVKFRHEKKVTQDEVASFLGVTKASVSKWENEQSMPDILLLPQIAVYFGVTVDELLGYEPQLSKEQIQRIYQELAKDFASQSFEDTMEKCKSLVHRYYSCFPFLQQICVLWLNHFMLANSQSAQREVLEEISDLSEHILKNCKIIEICNHALSFKAMVELQLGNPHNVIEILEDIVRSQNLSMSNNSVLIQAYQMVGDTDKALSSVQISIYIHLLELVGTSVGYLAINSDNLNGCEETIRRTGCVISAYNLDKLQPNLAAQFYYQSAVVYAIYKQTDKALEMLHKFERTVTYLLTGDNINLHGDSYFTALDSWFAQLDLGAAPPRDKKLIMDNAVESLDHPVFEAMKDTEAFQKIKQNLSKGRTYYE